MNEQTPLHGGAPQPRPSDVPPPPSTAVLRTMGEQTATRKDRRQNRKRVGWLHLPLWAGYVFLYLPIIVVIAMSFNSSQNLFVWRGFSFRWYEELLHNRAMLEGLGNTLIVAISVTVISTVLGTLMAVGIHRYTKGGLIRAFSIAPALLPDLLLGIGLLSFYALITMTLGLHSIVIAHSVFASAFVTAIVLARISSIDGSLEEASRDLGASPFRTFMRITLPQLMPGIVAGALLAFTLSLDEFVIAYFTAAPTTPTLPIVIYSTVRFGVTPDVNALASILLLISIVTILFAQRLTRIGSPKETA